MPRGVTLGPRFRDGLGVRVVEVEKTSGDTVEVLYLCPELCPFDKVIKYRSDRLSNFRHPRFVPVRGLGAVSSPHGRVGVIADHIVGPRLSEVLEAARPERVAVDTNAALHLIRELLSAITALHESRKVTHGAIGPERLIVTPRGRLVIVDYTLSLALERLQYNRTRLWNDFRIAVPPTAGAARFDQRTDVVQIGTVAVALLIGRPLDTADCTDRLEVLLDGVGEVTLHGDRKPLSPALHSWLERALPLEARKPFATARQANVALEQILIKERRLGVAPAALRALISRYLSPTGGSATEAHETAIDQPVQSAGEASTAEESVPSAPPASPGRDVLSLTSAVVEADPEVEGPFAAIPIEIVTDTAPPPGQEIGPRIIPEAGLGIAPESSSEAGSGIVSAIGSDITVEVASGIDAEFTVEIASGIVAATMVEERPEVGPGSGPDIATADAAESWAPADEAIAPPAEVPGITGFDADPERVLALETELGAAPKPHEPSAAAAEILTDLETPSPRTAAVSQPVQDEAASRRGELPQSPAEGQHEPRPEHREPAAEAAPDDVWVIDPSDLTFDPAFVDGLYQPLRADLGPLVPEPVRKVGAEPAIEPPDAAAPVAEAAAAPVDEFVSAPVPVPVAETVAETAAVAAAEAATEVVAEAVTDLLAAESVAEPVAEAIAPEEPPGVPERPAAAAPPAGSATPVLEPLEVLPALDASWPFVQESSAPFADMVAKIASSSMATPVAGSATSPATAPVAAPAEAPPVAAPPAAPVAETVHVPVKASAATLVADAAAEAAPEGAHVVDESVAEPIREAVAPEKPPDVVGPLDAEAPPAGSVTPVLEPLEVLPALDASWPFVQEPAAPLADLVTKLASKSVAAPTAARAGTADTAPVEAPPEATAAAEAIPPPAAVSAAAPVAELVAEPIVEVIAPQRLTDVAAPPPREETVRAELASDGLAVASPHAATTAEEGSGLQEAVEVFERLLESLRETPARPPVGALPEPAGVPCGVAGETPAGTLALADAPDESARDQVSAAAGPHVPIFEPPPVSGEAAVSAPPEEAPPAPAPPRRPIFSARETAARVARAVPKRLIDMGRTRLRWRQAAAAAVVVVALGGVRLATAYWFKAPPPTGELIVETVPDGLEVFVDNALRGRTPMSVTLPAGDHVLELRGKGLTRTLPVRIAPGVKAEERLSWPLSARTGRLRVESEPTKASVSIDGQPKGVTPLTIDDLPARVHTLVVQGRGGRVERAVTIEPEQTTTVKVPVFPGWMKVFSPFDLKIFEGGRLLGTTDVDRIMLRAGRHTVEFVNEELGYRVVRQVDITPGALAPVSMEPANGSLEIDAPPGFEVWLDGERVGETPLGPLQVSLGTHDVRLKHPQSGEERRTVVVTQREPAKVTAEGK